MQEKTIHKNHTVYYALLKQIQVILEIDYMTRRISIHEYKLDNRNEYDSEYSLTKLLCSKQHKKFAKVF